MSEYEAVSLLAVTGLFATFFTFTGLSIAWVIRRRPEKPRAVDKPAFRRRVSP